MKFLILLGLIIVSVNLKSQVVGKISISYQVADLCIDDTNVLATVKTHTNFDFINSGLYLFWSTNSERLYHFIYPESACYDLNRISLTYDYETKIYNSDFPIFIGEVSIKFTENYKELKITKDRYSIIFYN
jgi:hypothetical protein